MNQLQGDKFKNYIEERSQMQDRHALSPSFTKDDIVDLNWVIANWMSHRRY